MEKKSISFSAFLSLRALIALLLCASACFIAVGTVPAFLRPEARTKVSERTLTFTERVADQRAIEEVYWRHRIWPKDNPQPKPALDAIVSQAQLEKKVQDYLCKSQFVAEQRGSPITASELQAEMERMASHSKQPDVLREIFEALGSDPFVIAECLARPALAERFSADLTVVTGVSPVLRKLFAASSARSTEKSIRVTPRPYNAGYTLPEVSAPDDCMGDTWTATTTANAPSARMEITAVWTGSEIIVWGGWDFSTPYLNTGGRYNPTTDSWTATSTSNAPGARGLHTAVWTGTEMIIWGGEGKGGPIRQVNTGGRYNSITDSWVATNTANAPVPREQHRAVWTGSEMIVWGGFSDPDDWFNSGGRYTPDTDSWTATSTTNAPSARWRESAVWTGSEMIVWGGTDFTNYLHTGGRYNPTTNSWIPTSTTNAPLGRIGHTAVWTGSEMIVWGGVDETFNDTNSGGRYNPVEDTWTATSIMSAPEARDSHAAVWTGSEMIAWGGVFNTTNLDTGARYDPSTDSWTATGITNAPAGRYDYMGLSGLWTGNEMVIWGGVQAPTTVLNTGGRYCAQSGPTPTATATPTATPSATPTATATPSGTPRVTPTPRPRPTPHPRPTT